MRQPKLSNLVLDVEGTKRIREMAAKAAKIKITINIDEDTLKTIKTMAAKSGGSYQKTLNEILKAGLDKNNDAEMRLQKIEKEIAKIKKKLAA